MITTDRTFVPSLRRVEAIDRRIAAIHEAGHVVMGRHVGLSIVSAWLEKTPNPQDWHADKLWIGHTRFLKHRLSKKSPARLLKRTISKRETAMIAIAGAIAEQCWQRADLHEELWHDADVMSPSDWSMCRCHPGEPDRKLLAVITEVFSLFDRKKGNLWPALLEEARQLIVDSRPPVVPIHSPATSQSAAINATLTNASPPSLLAAG